jgi:hypothetical protein
MHETLWGQILTKNRKSRLLEHFLVDPHCLKSWIKPNNACLIDLQRLGGWPAHYLYALIRHCQTMLRMCLIVVVDPPAILVYLIQYVLEMLGVCWIHAYATANRRLG